MLKNEKGFTFLESIISLSFILLISSSFFPVMSNMLAHLKEGKKEMTAYRLMYEHVEREVMSGTMGKGQVNWKNITYEFFIEENKKGDWKACARYEKKTLCVD
ncbi:DNA transport platform protein [Bacillus freudenreichii]|nr:DNA transport platform protein [Bacillus freudenreichii]